MNDSSNFQKIVVDHVKHQKGSEDTHPHRLAEFRPQAMGSWELDQASTMVAKLLNERDGADGFVLRDGLADFFQIDQGAAAEPKAHLHGLTGPRSELGFQSIQVRFAIFF